jgi:hypothetical protein
MIGTMLSISRDIDEFILISNIRTYEVEGEVKVEGEL